MSSKKDINMIHRRLKIDLPKNQSAFLWGARKTGKSTFLKTQFPQSIFYDFLNTELILQFAGKPFLLRQQLEAAASAKLNFPVILDEVQKVPGIFDEVHWLIENKGIQFILCGSSARKLKRANVNLLGGRAWRFNMLPFISREIGDYDILEVLNRGLIPSHYLSSNYERSLKAYVIDYLKEEIFDEGLTRNIPAFSRFFDSLGYSHGELTNFSNIARDCGVRANTVKEYYQILVDTYLAYRIEPFSKSYGRQIITSTPKYYLFDVGVAGFLTHRRLVDTRGPEFGKAFEHFILMELKAYSLYSELDYKINFWRTKSGLEVDFILGGGEIAIEVKGSSDVSGKELRARKTFV